MRLWPGSTRVRVLLALVLIAGIAGLAVRLRGGEPGPPTVAVTRGDFVEVLETRGEIRPLRSVLVGAPYMAGELLILELAATGTVVKKGDPVAKFDAVALRRSLQDRQSELRTARAETAEAAERAKIQEQADASAVWRAENDVQRAKLDIGDPEILSQMETERTRLSIADAEQRLSEARVKQISTRSSAVADVALRQRKVAKVEADIAYTQRGLDQLEVVAPADGTVSVMQNYRSGSMTGGGALDFRPGDKAYAGAAILELPDLSAVHLAVRIDEADRGQLKAGQTATVRLDAIPDREYKATVDDISLLARVDYMSWPAAKNFDLKLSITDPDDRLRPGMSAVARISIGRLPNMLLVPASVVFPAERGTVVYRQRGHAFDEVPVEVIRRGREQIAVKGLNEGDRLLLTKPGADGKQAVPR